MKTVVKMVSSEKKYNRAETARPDKQLTIDDVPEHARSAMDDETQSDLWLNSYIRCVT